MKNLIKLIVVNVVLIFFFTIPSPAQIPDTMWTKTYGGTNIDIGHCVQQTFDGGYIITGYTRSFGAMSGRNVWLIKTDGYGNEIWNNAFGGNDDDEGYSVQQTADSGYIITGYTKSFGSGLNDVYLIKTDQSGNQIWSRTFGGPEDDEGYSIVKTSDGNFVIAGVTSSFGAGSRDVWLIKTDPSGNEIWNKTFGGLSSDGAWFVQKTFDNGFIITGWTLSQGPGFLGSVFLVKADSSGNQEWNKYFGGSDADRGYCVQQSADSGYIITGYTGSFGAGLYDMYLIKTDKLGNEQWTKTFGGSGRDYGYSLDITADGGFIITGYTLSFGAGGDDLWVVKTDFQGNEQWSNTYGGSSSDVGYYIKETSDGGCIITGHTLSFGAGVHDVWLIKTDNIIPVELMNFTAEIFENDVRLNWSTSTETNNSGFEIQRRIIDVNNEQWSVVGFVAGKGTTTEPTNYIFNDDISLVQSEQIAYRLKQIDYDGSYNFSKEIYIDNITLTEFSLEQNYPNPFNPTTTIQFNIPEEVDVTLKIFDALGSEVFTMVSEKMGSGRYEYKWDASAVPGGVYFYRLTAGSFVSTKKLIVLK